ncbi:MAG: Fic family protein [Candidatus Micrarchaeia archaeon]
MDPENFAKTVGRLVKDEEKGYFYFVPAQLPVRLQIDDELLDLLMKASKELGELKAISSGFSAAIGFSPLLFIRPYLTKEAVLSSKIEGTVSTLYDVLDAEASGLADKARGDLLEVINYVRAQETGIREIKQGSDINIELVAKLHAILLSRVRGEEAKPGTIREVQNYISRAGFAGMENAVYVPPKASIVGGLLDNLFSYMSSDTAPNLVKLALMHYQFEAIHPFLDGNGRIGRLLIILYLIKFGELPEPLLYVSEYFERNRDEYYERLLEVSTLGKYVEWAKFFMKGVIEQSENAIDKSSKLLEYHKEIASTIRGTRHVALVRLIDFIFAHPILTIPMVARELKVSYPAAKAAVLEAARLGILQYKESTVARRPKRFVAQRILEIYNA